MVKCSTGLLQQYRVTIWMGSKSSVGLHQSFCDSSLAKEKPCRHHEILTTRWFLSTLRNRKQLHLGTDSYQVRAQRKTWNNLPAMQQVQFLVSIIEQTFLFQVDSFLLSPPSQFKNQNPRNCYIYTLGHSDEMYPSEIPLCTEFYLIQWFGSHCLLR